MESVYLPAASRSAGKLKRPCSSVTTVIVTGEASFLGLTSTPSIAPSSTDDTVPLSAACASASPAGKADISRNAASAIAVLGCMGDLPNILIIVNYSAVLAHVEALSMRFQLSAGIGFSLRMEITESLPPSDTAGRQSVPAAA